MSSYKSWEEREKQLQPPRAQEAREAIEKYHLESAPNSWDPNFESARKGVVYILRVPQATWLKVVRETRQTVIGYKVGANDDAHYFFQITPHLLLETVLSIFEGGPVVELFSTAEPTHPPPFDPEVIWPMHVKFYSVKW